jgi:non-specific serine/threonine protein kinase
VSSFVGRGRELAELRRLLAGTRLLTLAGPGGIGKTRLALALAQMILSDFVDGVWLVELGSLTDPALVARAVATTLRVGEEAGVALIDALAEGLRAQHLLLILDNCEHVLAACAELIQQLLQACPELCILTTGREPLGMTGETIWRVPGLALGDSDMSPAQAPPDASEAVQLLVARAGAASSTFALTDKNAKAVDELCRNLEGIPLAYMRSCTSSISARWLRTRATSARPVR